MSNEELMSELRALHGKVDRVIGLLEESKSRKTRERKPPKPKPLPLTESEIKELQSSFDRLFERWDSGDELHVQDQLEALDVEQLRRFADANNLNVTAKMAKHRVLQLIAARFREKRQLHKSKVEAHTIRPTTLNDSK